MSSSDANRVRERRTAVAVLCSDLAHELNATLLFLRGSVARETDPEDRSIGQEEIARLESVVGALRRTRRPELPVETLRLRKVVERVIAGMHLSATTEPRVDVDISDDATLTANVHALETLLCNLVRNAADAARAELRLRACFGGGAHVLEIEDDGPGLPAALEPRLFHPLATLRQGGAGTGVPSALAIAREHGWTLDYVRRHDRTVVRVEFRAHAERGGER